MRIHGRNGILYLSRNFGDQASPIVFLSDWSIVFTRELSDVTTIVDTQTVYVATESSASGTFAGFFNTATAQSYSAAVNGLPRAMYLYPSTGDPVDFFSGMVLPDYSIGAGVAAAVALTVTWAASGLISKNSGLPGLLDESSFAEVLDEAAGILLNEDGS